MPVYTDKRGRLFIKFGFQANTYKRRLPEGTTKETAKDLEATWRRDLLHASFGVTKSQNINYKDFLTKHFLPFAEQHYSEAGYKNVIVICKASLRYLEKLALRRITPEDIEKFKRHRLALLTKHGTERMPSTVNRELNIISKICSYAIRLNFLDYNPCSKVDRPHYDNIQDKVLPVDKIGKLLDNFNSVWARDITILILNTGLRQNDALGLKKTQVDFENKVIRLTQGKSQRRVVIPINEVVLELLLERDTNGSNLFFPSPKTGKQGTSIKKALQLAADNAGVGKVGTRVLRRTFATRLAEMNYSPSAIAKLLGHSDLRSVHRYGRETEILREMVDALDTVKRANIVPFKKKKSA